MLAELPSLLPILNPSPTLAPSVVDSSPYTDKNGQNALNANIGGSSTRINSMQEIFNKYINYLEAERGAYAYTVIYNPAAAKISGTNSSLPIAII